MVVRLAAIPSSADRPQARGHSPFATAESMRRAMAGLDPFPAPAPVDKRSWTRQAADNLARVNGAATAASTVLGAAPAAAAAPVDGGFATPEEARRQRERTSAAKSLLG